MTKKYTYTAKSTGDSLTAAEWNNLAQDVDAAVNAINSGAGSGGGAGLPNLYINSKGNLNLETSAEIGNTSKGKINIESIDDIQLKPGDDIILYSHHRAQDKQDEVAVKVTDGDDVPVKLQLNTAEMVLTTKDKTGNNANVMDITVNADKNTRGYLKVRAQAIDLRSESHGGIALQPKGEDSDHNMNKIKFEHGGGDGLEFGTFNTEKTSIFTDEYRFNKDGVWKMATREKEVSDKADVSDPTTAYKYVKQFDDFYDITNHVIVPAKFTVQTTEAEPIFDDGTTYTGDSINEIIKQSGVSISEISYQFASSGSGYGEEASGNYMTEIPAKFFKNNHPGDTLTVTFYNDKRYTFTCTYKNQYAERVSTTTEDIIKTANALNGELAKTHITNKGNLEIETTGGLFKYLAEYSETPTTTLTWFKGSTHQFPELENNSIWTADELITICTPDLKSIQSGYESAKSDLQTLNVGDIAKINVDNQGRGNQIVTTVGYFQKIAPGINIESAENIKLEAAGKLELKGILDFGNTFNFGETETGIQTQYKLTKKNVTKDCGKLQVVAVNNHASNNLTIAKSIYDNVTDPLNPTLDTADATIAPGTSTVVASCPLIDVIRLVNYMKYNQQGPWTSAQP